MWNAFAAIIKRELIKLSRQRGRLISSMVRPLIWLLVIGAGFQTLIGEQGQTTDYRQFMAPGLICMTLLFGSMLASLSMIYDKESGVMRMLIVAPYPHAVIVLARMSSAIISGLVQALLLLMLLMLLGYVGQIAHPLLLILALILTAAVCAASGMLIAVYSKTLENFAVIMNFVIFPMFFLSGALYPLQQLPIYLKLIAYLNPFSYGVDLMKHAMLSTDLKPFAADLPVWIDIGVMLVFTVIATTLACLRFSDHSVSEKLTRVLSAGKRA